MSDDLPKRYVESDRLRTLESKVQQLSVGGGASEVTVLEDENGVLRYESGLLTDGSYGVQVYDADGLPVPGGGGPNHASQLPFTPVGDIGADNVQDALAEIDAETSKLGHFHDIVSPIDPLVLREYRRLYGSELRRWFADLSMCGTQKANVLVIGDSVASGSGADAAPAGSPTEPGRWIEVFLRRMQQAYGTGRGSPYMPARWAFVGTNGTVWTHSSGVSGSTSGGLGMWAVNIGNNTANYIETSIDCDAFQIFYPSGLLGGMGDFAIIVDGVTVATVDIPQTGGNWSNVWDSRVAGVKLAPGRHTVRIKCAVTGTVLVEGGIFYNGDYSNGVHVYDGSKGGVGSEFFGTNTTWLEAVTQVAPSLVIYALGLNDLTFAPAIASFKGYVHAALDGIRAATAFDPSEVILIPYAHAYEDVPAGYPDGHPESDWWPYREALYEVAEERGAAVIDLYHLVGYGEDASDVVDLIGPDEIHLNERGHRFVGNIVADLLMGSGPSDRGVPDVTMPMLGDSVRPPTGTARLRVTNYANRPTLELQPALGNGITRASGMPFDKLWTTNQPGVTTMNTEGVGGLIASTGTVTVTGPTPPFFPRYVEYATAATINTNSGQGDNDLLWSRVAGFFFTGSVMWTNLNNARTFLGLTSGTLSSTVTAADPGNHHAGFAFSTGFTWTFSTRDGTTRTTTDTGVPISTSEPVSFYIWCPSQSTTVYWALKSSATLQSGSSGVTTNLPGMNTAMRRVWALQTTDAVAKAMRVVRLYCETDVA